MKLELGKIHISDVQFGEKTEIKGETLYVNAKELSDLVLKDDRLLACHVELARPGESVRITPVKDVIEPRLKVEGPGCVSRVLWGRLPKSDTGRLFAWMEPV